VALWATQDLELPMRVGMVPIESIREAGLDVCVSRYAASPNVRYAMFAGGGIRWAERIFSISHTHLHFAELARVVAPQGRICVIDDPEPIDVRLLKARCASLHWEAMFTRSGFETPDMAEQGRLLNEVAALVDDGLLHTTHARTLGRIDAANLRAAHAMIESGHTIGKITLAGF